MISTEVKRTKCPNCGLELDRATGVGVDREPTEGDYTVCMYCGIGMRFGKDGELIKLTQEELDKAPKKFWDVMAAVGDRLARGE